MLYVGPALLDAAAAASAVLAAGACGADDDIMRTLPARALLLLLPLLLLLLLRPSQLGAKAAARCEEEAAMPGVWRKGLALVSPPPSTECKNTDRAHRQTQDRA